MVIGDERIAPLKNYLLDLKDVVLMDAKQAPLQDVQLWLMQDANQALIPTERIYILAGIWNFIENTSIVVDGESVEGIKLRSHGMTDLPLLREFEDIILETIQRVEGKYSFLKVVICPIIGVHIEGHNVSQGIETFVDGSQDQDKLNDILIDANNIIQRINKGRGMVTPRFDRNYFYYNCRTKNYRIYYVKLDDTRFVSDNQFSKQIAEKIVSSMDK